MANLDCIFIRGCPLFIVVLSHRDDEVLLVRNQLFLLDLFSGLAGLGEPGESLEKAVRREIHEEVGISVGQISYHAGQPRPFSNSLMLGFHAEYNFGDICLQEEEVAEAHWLLLE